MCVFELLTCDLDYSSGVDPESAGYGGFDAVKHQAVALFRDHRAGHGYYGFSSSGTICRKLIFGPTESRATPSCPTTRTARIQSATVRLPTTSPIIASC